MVSLVNLSCPCCGGKLQINNDINRFTCGYCGNEILVEHSGGALIFEPVIVGINQVRKGVDTTASELAIARLKDEINDLKSKKEKAISDIEIEKNTTIKQFYKTQKNQPGCFWISLWIFGMIISIIVTFSTLNDGVTWIISVPVFIGFSLFAIIWGVKKEKISQFNKVIDENVLQINQEYKEKEDISAESFNQLISIREKEIEDRRELVGTRRVL